ncbi:MAG TPA: FHA domain-containing protein, partial [Pseudonocardiaceae bacterium]|nr:FHA domain-containing protein [Pseudonocardiaceae bacterium]
EENHIGDALCGRCGFLLPENDGYQPAGDTPAPVARPPAPERCPACGAEVPDPTNIACVECLEEFGPVPPRVAGDAGPARTRRESSSLRLVFGSRAVGVLAPGSIVLGRDPAVSPVAGLFSDSDNVSRRHACVGLDVDGSAWVRDENSTNGTFVNDKPVPSGRRTPLADGDRLRIASNVVARVEFGRPGPVAS